MLLEKVTGEGVAHLDKPLEKIVFKPRGDVGEGAEKSPWLSHLERGPRQSAADVHEERSRQAQDADESFNAPIADTFRQWVENPNRYDLQGVDTIPEDTLRARAERFLRFGVESGAIEDVKIGWGSKTSERKPGRFEARRQKGSIEDFETTFRLRDPEKLKKKALVPMMEAPFIAAHETGHGIDFEATGKGSSQYRSEDLLGIGVDSDVFEQARDLSARMRGEFDVDDDYRYDPAELAADALAAYALEPRAARREAPDLIGMLERDIVAPAAEKASKASGKTALEVDLRGE